jgi:hypothetical protein
MTGTGMKGRDIVANRVKPAPPGMTGGILGTAFARGAGRGSGRPLNRRHAVLFSFITPRQELHPYDDGH